MRKDSLLEALLPPPKRVSKPYNMEKVIGFIYCICFLISGQNLYAQGPLSFVPYSFAEVLDTVSVRIVYRLDYVSDVSRREQIREQELELLLGSRYEQFKLSSSYFDRDKSLPKGTASMAPAGGLAGSVLLTRRETHRRQVYIKGIAPSTTVEYIEELTTPQWKIESETQKIMGYTCQKATTSYLGRNYIAWFASQIPIDAGPWKLRGLPGLILRAQDLNKEYSFETIEIQAPPKPTLYIKAVKGPIKASTRPKVNELLIRLHKDILRASEIVNGVRPKVIGSTANTIPVPYNPIELK